MSKRLGYVEVIDAAYRTDLAEDVWLEGLLAAAVPLLDFGQGVAAISYRVSDAGGLELSGVAATADMRAFEPTSRGYLDQPQVPMVGRMFQRTDALFLRRDAAGAPADHPSAFEYWSALGVLEAFGLVGYDVSGYGVMLSALAPADARISPGRRQLLRCVAAHIASAVRLRKAPSATETGDVESGGAEALLSSDGTIVSATPALRHTSAGQSLQRAVGALSRARSHELSENEAVQTWHALWSGRWTLVDREERDGRCYLVARRNEPQVSEPKALSLRERQVLSYVKMGHSQKFIAFELGLGPSTVAGHLASGMRKLGVSSIPELVTLGCTGPASGAA
jgi:DNA-binding NarL/FixJ family response regulator